MAVIESAVVVEAVAGGVPASAACTYELDGGIAAIEVEASTIVAVLEFLRDEPSLAFRMFLDLTAIDHEADLGQLELVYSLRSLEHGRVAIKTRVDAAAAQAPSISTVFRGANWAEREVYDMFGVDFVGHPDLTRILMYEEFVGYPLRKSYPFDKRQPLVPERDPINNPWPKRYT
ncbi:MAG: NADH-quinone oxidoreductase subunit C [Hyphomicrobiaceae bacterium]|jgi:NADH-quinone oxidoreductase subunit C